QAQLLQSLARDSQNETRQLAAAVETLNNDRDRLYARVTVLEQGLESVTGTLARQGSTQATGKPQGPTAQAATPAPAQQATTDAQPSSPFPPAGAAGAAGPSSNGWPYAGSSGAAPSVAPVTTTNAPISDKNRADGSKQSAAASQAQPFPTTLSAMAAAPATSNPPSSAAS